MPSGIYIRTKIREPIKWSIESRQRISGKNNSACRSEVKEKISNSLKKYYQKHPEAGWAHRKGKPSWNAGLIGYKSGSNHWNWQGGKSSEIYDDFFNNTIHKFFIKQSFNFTCILCGDMNINLCIHHIDYNKKNSNTFNLVPLCRSCHAITNYNREFWIEYFQSIIKSLL